MKLLLGAILAAILATAPAMANELRDEEAATRQIAVRVLEALKPIELWVERAAVAPAPPVDVKQLVKVTGPRVNMRAGPTVEASVLNVAKSGEFFEYVSTDGDWYLVVTADERRAYVSRRFSELTTATSQQATPPETKLQLMPGFESRARDILGRNKSSIGVLQRLASRAESEYERRYGRTQPGPNNATQRAELKSLNKIRKYRRVASDTYDKYAALVGDVKQIHSSSVRPPVAIRGTLKAGVGSNTATVEIVDGAKTETDVTRTEFAADLTADLTPSDRLNLQAGHREEIRFAPTAQTRGAVDYQRKLGDQATLGARIGLDQYKNDANDLTNVDRTDLGLRGRIAPSERFHADAALSVTSASYENSDILDYKDTRIALGAGGKASPKTTWGFGFKHATHDLDDDALEDNTRNNIDGNVTFRTSARSTIAIIGRSEGTTFDEDDNPGNYRRTGLEIQGRNRSGPGSSGMWSLAVRAKGHDVVEDRNFTEFRGVVQARSGLGSNKERSSQFVLNYRNFKGKDNPAYLDYVEGRWDSKRARTGILWESNTFVQYFIKNGTAERNPLIRQFAWLGIMLAANQSIVIGPHIATNTELVTIDGSDLGVFESPSNTIRYGVKGTARFDVKPVRIDGSARYEITEFYNIDNSSAPARFELEGRGIYTINAQFDATGQLKYYSVGASDPGSIRTSEFDILLGLIYNIGRRR